MAKVLIKRGTRAQIDAAAAASQLSVGEPYLITDEARISVATAVNAHQPAAKQGESSGGGSFPFYVAAGTLDSISLISGTALPFFVANGTQDNINLVV